MRSTQGTPQTLAVRRFPRRQNVTEQLLAVPELLVNYVIFEEASIRERSAVCSGFREWRQG
jgi:hypothetical protein